MLSARRGKRRSSMNRNRFLYVHGVTTEVWCARYDLEPYTRPCSDCGEPCTTTRPFALGTLRGLAAPPCTKCGNERTPFCLVRDPKHGDLFDGDLNG